MPGATYAISSFLGGEISQFAQGRFDRPDYRISLNVCLNAFPVEIGAWARRPGSAYASHTRGGAAGRVMDFDFEQSAPAEVEYTDGFVRFRAGTVLLGTNDDQTVTAVSTANPAVLHVPNAVTWATGDTVLFPGASTPLLENRQFTVTKVDTTHFSLADALTGAAIDGSTLGALAAGSTVRHIQELMTPYVGGSWTSVRTVQAETTQVILCPKFPPQALTVETEPGPGVQAQFDISAVVFQDGPYLDPFTNGAQVTPGSQIGIVSLTLSLPLYGSNVAYAEGDYVSSSGVDYVSLSDQNVGNTPASSPTFWKPTTASAAINNGQGFLGSDVGRLIRLLSEPTAWSSSATYSAGSVVAYNPSGVPGATTYWQSLTSSNTNNAPGANLSNWEIIAQGAAIWTWGRITSLTNLIARNLAGSTAIGNMVGNAGLNAAFDGTLSKQASSCAGSSQSGGSEPAGTVLSLDLFVGKNFGGTPQKIAQATVYPANDLGFGFGQYIPAFQGNAINFGLLFNLNLRAKQTAPTFGGDGTLLGTSNLFDNQTRSVTMLSNDTTTLWNYVWVELLISAEVNVTCSSYFFDGWISQLSLYSPTTPVTSSAGCNAEILGPPLLYTTTIKTWRLGAYSDTTGWPTDGTYDDGRLWLGGAISNRFDSSTSNGIVPGSSIINFAPTDQYGNVADSNAISETINADSTNPIFWMKPDLQGILIGTQGGEFILQAPSSGSISPSNITSRRTTRIGSNNIEPMRTEHTLLFVKRYGRKVMEYFADVYSGKFSAPNLAERAEHITRAGVAELAYTEAVTPIVWGRDTAGALFGVTYKRDALTTSQGPTYAAWHRHALGSGRLVESICAGPSVDGQLDSLAMVTNDSLTSVRHVELLTDTPDELSPLADCWFLDDAVNPTSVGMATVEGPVIYLLGFNDLKNLKGQDGNLLLAPESPDPSEDITVYGGLIINGLWHLNGKTVQVFAGGCDCGDRGDQQNDDGTKVGIRDFLVTNGSVTVPFGDGISAGPGAGLFTQALFQTLTMSQIVIGFTYNSDGQIVRRIEPAESGSRTGPSLGLIRRNHRISMLLSNSLGLSIGATFSKMFPALFKGANGRPPLPPLTTFSGIHQDSVLDDYGYDGMLCWRVSRPFPANVVAISGNLQTQDQ